MIDALFGSKTRVKLLYLFLNNPTQPFYVREITRKISEQINSVRRELSNMIEVGIITSDSSDNKLYYQVNQRYDYYVPLRAIFSSDKEVVKSETNDTDGLNNYQLLIGNQPDIRVAILAGILVDGSDSSVDLLLAGDISNVRSKLLIKNIEKIAGREINYSILSYEDFYYRLSVRDRFITQVLNSKHQIVIDKDSILSRG